MQSTVSRWSEPGVATDTFQNFFLERYAEAYRAEIAHFAEILAGRASPSVGYDDGVAALELAEAAAQSVRSGQPVTLRWRPRHR
jgi:myo-inositol 2-dehydrogenase/D-chiro-inositol 1-dehydrogenase